MWAWNLAAKHVIGLGFRLLISRVSYVQYGSLATATCSSSLLVLVGGLLVASRALVALLLLLPE